MEKSFKEDKPQCKIAQQTCISCSSVFTKKIYLPNLFSTRKKIFWNYSEFKWLHEDYQNTDFPFNFQLGHRM